MSKWRVALTVALLGILAVLAYFERLEPDDLDCQMGYKAPVCSEYGR